MKSLVITMFEDSTRVRWTMLSGAALPAQMGTTVAYNHGYDHEARDVELDLGGDLGTKLGRAWPERVNYRPRIGFTAPLIINGSFRLRDGVAQLGCFEQRSSGLFNGSAIMPTKRIVVVLILLFNILLYGAILLAGGILPAVETANNSSSKDFGYFSSAITAILFGGLLVCSFVTYGLLRANLNKSDAWLWTQIAMAAAPFSAAGSFVAPEYVPFLHYGLVLGTLVGFILPFVLTALFSISGVAGPRRGDLANRGFFDDDA